MSILHSRNSFSGGFKLEHDFRRQVNAHRFYDRTVVLARWEGQHHEGSVRRMPPAFRVEVVPAGLFKLRSISEGQNVFACIVMSGPGPARLHNAQVAYEVRIPCLNGIPDQV